MRIKGDDTSRDVKTRKSNAGERPRRCANGRRSNVKLMDLRKVTLRSVCVIVGALSLSGCAMGPCAGWGVVHSRPGDAFTDKTAKEILKNNEYGAALKCPGFTPRGGRLRL